jgi:Ser/Thr protein kinase RdoA (MazF antagonist)
MQNQQEFFTEIAQEALKEYNLNNVPVIYLNHSENVTFQVIRPGGSSSLLRIHEPVVPALGDHGANPSVVKSELLWLEALRQKTDLPIPRPIRNRRGHLVTRITFKREQRFNCTMLEWLEGEAYERDFESAETATQIGIIVGKLHQFASQWYLPAGFVRPRRDITYFQKAFQTLAPAVEDKRISYKDYKCLETSLGLLTGMMQTLRRSHQTEGILHGDLHKGNFLYRAGEIRLIDFSMCCTGNFMFDLGICFSDMNPALHPFFLEGYRQYMHLPFNYAFMIEAFFIGSMLGTFSFWIDNPAAQEDLVRKAPLIAQDYAAKFNRDERFWRNI